MAKNIFNRLLDFSGSTTADLSGDATTEVIDLSVIDAVSIQIELTGSPVGTLKVEVSNNGNKFIEIPGSNIAINGADDVFYEIISNADKIRISYARTSGTGNMTAQMNAISSEPS